MHSAFTDNKSGITIKDLIPAIKEVVESGGEATFTPFGISMRPMLYGGRDEIILKKPELPLKKYDLPLYVRDDGAVILHRVIKVQNGRYIMRGDNTYSDELNLRDENIVATVIRFKRKNKWYSVDKVGYRIYCKIWVGIYPLRRFIKRVEWKLKSIIKSLIGIKK